MRFPVTAVLLCLIAIPAFAPVRAWADDTASTIRFRDHHWDPLSLTVPSRQPLTLKVINDSKEIIEFESFKLNREKAITPGQTISVKLPGLSPGTYDFYDDFHQDVPQGTIVAK